MCRAVVTGEPERLTAARGKPWGVMVRDEHGVTVSVTLPDILRAKNGWR